MAVVAFNLFGDAVSLVETRWILRRSKSASLLGIAFFLVLDLVLSALIYLALPGIAHQDFKVLAQAVLLKGPMPWIGILFWSTFMTSLLFYGFVLAVAVLRVVGLVVQMTKWLDKWFGFYSQPGRLVTFAMVIVWTIILGIWSFLK